MKQLAALLLALMLVSGTCSAQTLTHVSYAADDSNFPNPGRGFYHADDQLELGTLETYPDEGITLVLREYHIDEYRDTKIPVGYLWNIRRDLNTLRQAGLKVILRFRYTAKTSKPYGDAPLNIVLMHIKQFEPILRENSDVIFTFQAGFIGAWGEWYYTDYFSASPGNITEQNWIDRRTLVDSLLSDLPPEIMVNVRTPYYKRHLLDEESYNPVTINQAYTNTPVARISHHNDCFLASASDVGTYTDTTVQKPYLAEDTKYTVIGGETCGQSGYSHCENALKELKRFHWSYLNRDYHQGVIGDWIDEGCYPEIQKKLGYRFKMIDGDYTQSSNPGGTFLFKLKMINEGFANPVNPMNAEIILHGKSNKQTYLATINGDIRFWPIDDTISLDLSYGLPQLMVPDDYELFFRIVDAHTTLNNNPSYSIRMANQGVWDSVTGYNKLNHLLTVSNNTTSYYTGADFFAKKDIVLPYNPDFMVDGLDTEWRFYPIVYQNHNQNAQILKAWNTSDSLYFMIKGTGMGEETSVFVDADNNTETGIDGFDYKITCCKLFYSTTGEWQELQGALPDYAANDSIKELAIALSNLNQVSLSDYYGLRVLSGTDYLPDVNLPAAKAMKNKITTVPYVKVQNKGNTNTVFWNRNLEDENGLIELYRCQPEAGGRTAATTLGLFASNVISYQDKEVDPSKTYIYSASYVSGNYRSLSGGFEHEITAESNTQEYIDIKLNGDSTDWNLCKPVATGLIDEPRIQSVRFFNTADSIFYSLEMEGDTIRNYQLYFNLDGATGFEYKISNDTLFENQNDNWVFQNLITSYGSAGFLEAGLKLNQIGFDSIDYLTAVSYINGKEVWGNGDEFPFLKYDVLEAPENFQLKVSSEIPYHRIRIKWSFSSNPDKYVIERSVDDSLHFTQLTVLNSNKSYFLDNDVDSAHVYYYRMFSHKDILRSPYTQTMWMRPGVTGINSIARNSGSITVFPVPVKNRSVISIALQSPDRVTVDIITLSGKKISTLFKGSVTDKKNIDFNASKLSAGIYLISVTGRHTLLMQKVVVQ